MKDKLIVPMSSLKTTRPSTSLNSNRKTRWDKLHPRKFPVTYDQAKALTNLFYQKKAFWGAASMTEFLTMMMRIGLRRTWIVEDEVVYETKTGYYKTVKPNTFEKEKISGSGGLAIELGIFKERPTIHRIIINVYDYLESGGKVDYEDIQPIRPTE